MTFVEILKQFNWLDFFVLILLFRIGYVSVKNGLPLELFKLTGVTLSAYFSLHYYIVLSEWAGSFGILGKMPGDILSFILFVILAIAPYLAFVFLRRLFLRLINIEAETRLDRWGGLILGLIRGILVASLVIYICAISPLIYFYNSAKSSFTSRYLVRIAPVTYTLLWEGIVSKFRPDENFNKRVDLVGEDMNLR